MRQISADSKYLGEIFSELLRQAWCFATDQEMKGCECRKLKELAVFFIFFGKMLVFSKKSLTLQGKSNFCVRKNFFNIY